MGVNLKETLNSWLEFCCMFSFLFFLYSPSKEILLPMLEKLPHFAKVQCYARLPQLHNQVNRPDGGGQSKLLKVNFAWNCPALTIARRYRCRSRSYRTFLASLQDLSFQTHSHLNIFYLKMIENVMMLLDLLCIFGQNIDAVIIIRQSRAEICFSL